MANNRASNRKSSFEHIKRTQIELASRQEEQEQADYHILAQDKSQPQCNETEP
jgi:hypothetical protein